MFICQNAEVSQANLLKYWRGTW